MASLPAVVECDIDFRYKNPSACYTLSSRTRGSRVADAAARHPLLETRMAGAELRVGLRISARYQTNKIGFDTAWYTGSVLAVNSDGSCDIAYDDGEMERGILPEHVKVATHSFCSLKSTPIYGGNGADGKKELSDDAKLARASRGKGVGKNKRAGKAPAKRCETPSEGGSGEAGSGIRPPTTCQYRHHF